MLVLLIQGSPRKKGNTAHLLSTLLDNCHTHAIRTRMLHVTDYVINPCIGCGVCEKKGRCRFMDDMSQEIYPLIWEADVVVLGTPMYFYHAPAQLKALIDRIQALWSRKYRFHLTDPGRNKRCGLLLAIGATKGKNLFDGMELTAKYFFDAAGADYKESLLYREIENIGDMATSPFYKEDLGRVMQDHILPLAQRKKVLFVCRKNDHLSQMACAFAQIARGDLIEAMSAGLDPAKESDAQMRAIMAEEGIDMMYRRPTSLSEILANGSPETIVFLNCQGPEIKERNIKQMYFQLKSYAGDGAGSVSQETMRSVRDEIKAWIKDHIDLC